MSDSNWEWMEAEDLAEHVMALLEKYDVKWRRHGLIYVDHQPGNITTVNIILAELSNRFGVPSQLIRARLIELKWLNDARYTSARDDALRVAASLCSSTAAVSEADAFEMDDEEYEKD
jgi:Zn-dependent peptidase ImmA (M78 family)